LIGRNEGTCGKNNGEVGNSTSNLAESGHGLCYTGPRCFGTSGYGSGEKSVLPGVGSFRLGAIMLVVSPLVGLMENQVIQPFWYISDSGRCWTFDRDPEINQFQKVFHMIYAHKESIFEAKIDKILKFLEYMQSVNIRY